MLRAAIAICVLFAAACAAPEPGDTAPASGDPGLASTADPVIETPAPRASISFAGAVATADERAACDEAGGVVERAGLRGAERCTQSYPDAGTPCMDTSECEGLCLQAGDNVDFGQRTDGGRCQATDNPFGCYTEVLDGRAEATLCVD